MTDKHLLLHVLPSRTVILLLTVHISFKVYLGLGLAMQAYWQSYTLTDEMPSTEKSKIRMKINYSTTKPLLQ